MSKLSIVIPVFNKWNFTKSCLNDLDYLSRDNHEIIVIDNGSSDQTKDELITFENRISIIKNQENTGFAKACNEGFKASTGDVVMFLNNDIRVQNHKDTWTEEVVRLCGDDYIVGPTGGYVDPNNDFRFLYETSERNKPVNYMSGWCLSALKTTFNKLIINDYKGPFSEEFGTAYFEDTDLGFRALRLGMHLSFVDIPVHHFGRITSNQLNTHKLYTDAKKIFADKWSR